MSQHSNYIFIKRIWNIQQKITHKLMRISLLKIPLKYTHTLDFFSPENMIHSQIFVYSPKDSLGDSEIVTPEHNLQKNWTQST